MTEWRMNFEPVSDLLKNQTRDFPMADRTLVRPSSALRVYDGEWLRLDDTNKLVRAVDIAGVVGVDTAVYRSYPLFAEPGRYDIQALSGSKVPLIWLGEWEFETRIFDATLIVGTGLAIAHVGQALKVALIQPGGVGTRLYSGLVGHGWPAQADTDPIVGYVTRLPGTTGKLRLRSGFAS